MPRRELSAGVSITRLLSLQEMPRGDRAAPHSPALPVCVPFPPTETASAVRARQLVGAPAAPRSRPLAVPQAALREQALRRERASDAAAKAAPLLAPFPPAPQPASCGLAPCPSAA